MTLMLFCAAVFAVIVGTIKGKTPPQFGIWFFAVFAAEGFVIFLLTTLPVTA